MSKYFWKILVSIDQLINTIFFGDEDETISSRAGKAQLKGEKWGCILCKFLDLFEKDHCSKNIEWDEGDDS